ncbi:MAG: hypothetical protein U0166_00725 [Acidobacteriota bacterium]
MMLSMAKKAKDRSIALVVAAALALGLVAAPASATGIPVIDIIQEVEQVIHEYLMVLDKAMQYYHFLQMLKEGDWYGLLSNFLYLIDDFFPDADVGQFTATIAEARNLYMGASGAYGQTKAAMNEIFGGDEEIRTGRAGMVDFLDAVALRSAKEIGQYRAGKDARRLKAEEILGKAEGYTGTDRQLQLANSTLANLMEAMSDQTMKIVTTNELLSTMVETQREQLHGEELLRQTASEGFGLFVQNMPADLKPIVIP